MRGRIGAVLLCLLTCLASRTVAQSAQYSCPHFGQGVHQAVDCIEALFSEDLPYLHGHFILGSVPPGNGFAMGVVIENPEHFVSPFATRLAPDLRDTDTPANHIPMDPEGKQGNDLGGFKSLFVPRLVAAASLNGSWYVSGSGDWLPGIYSNGQRRGVSQNPRVTPPMLPCHKLGNSICTDQVLAVHFEGTHRVARTIAFYGIGPASPATEYTFRLDDTYGGMHARMPLTNFLSVTGGVEGRYAELPVELLLDSVYTHFTAATLPGLGAEPTYVHGNAGFLSRGRHVSEAKKPSSPNALFKRRDAFGWDGGLSGHWFREASGQAYSFRQEEVDANVSIEPGAVIQGYRVSTQPHGAWTGVYYRFLQSRCGGPPADPRTDVNRYETARERAELKAQDKQSGIAYELKHTDYCDFGTVSFRSHLVASQAASGGTIPFFMKPTVGGQDIESRLSLRGFPDYRFRGSNAAFVQAEYSLPVWDPLGLLVFYDAGNAGDRMEDLSFAHVRQDGGLGINVRVMRVSLAQVFMAWGQGHGVHLGYALSKRF